MLKLAVLLITLLFATGADAASAARPPTLPTAADCVQDDTVVCAFRVVRESDLAASGGAILAAPAGLPRVERVQLLRIGDGVMLLIEYFTLDPTLQGAAL